MNRLAKRVLLIGGLSVAAMAAFIVLSSMALTRTLDPDHHCETGFSVFVSCTYERKSTSIGQSEPIFITPSGATGDAASSSSDSLQPISVVVTSSATADCPQGRIARRLLCPTPAAAEAGSEDATTGLPLPKPWFLTREKNSPSIKSLHVETSLDLATVLGFYRGELKKRGWTEEDGAAVATDRATITFATSEGPALLRLARQEGRTIADLSLRKSDAAGPSLGQVKLMLSNVMDQEVILTVNAQTIKLAARSRLKNGPNIDLPPGNFKVALTLPDGVAKSSEFVAGADEAWSVVVGRDGVPSPLRLY